MEEKISKIVLEDPHGNTVSREISTSERDAEIARHNASEEAHPYIQGLVEDAKQHSTDKVATHNEDPSAHESIRNSVTEAKEKADAKVEEIYIGNEPQSVEEDGKRVVHFRKDQFGKVDGIKVNDGEDLPIDEDGKVSIPVPTTVEELSDSADYATKEDAQGYVDAAKITTATATADNSVGTPRVVPTINGQNIHFDIYGIKGEKGNDGYTVILNTEPGDPTEPNHYKLYSELGGNTDGAMTQKAFSDIIGYKMFEDTHTYDAKPSSTQTPFVWTGLNIPAGKKLRFRFTGLGTVVKQWRYRFNDGTAITTNKEKIDVLPTFTGDTLTKISVQLYAADFTETGTGTVGVSVEWIGLSSDKEDIEDLNAFKVEAEAELGNLGTLNAYQDALSKEIDMQKIVPELTWNNGQINMSGKLVASDSLQYTSPVEVKRNDIVLVKAQGNNQYTIMLAWVVNEGYLYDMIYKYSANNQWLEYTFRVQKDGYFSICRKASTATTFEIFRGVDASANAVVPNILRVPSNALQKSNGNLFNPVNAINHYKLSSASAEISSDASYWMTGFIELPPNVNYLHVNYGVYGNYSRLYNAEGTVLSLLDPRSPIYLNLKTYPTAKYVRLSFSKDTIPFEERRKLMVTGFWQETDTKPYAYLDQKFVGIRDAGIFQLSDLTAYEAEKVFGTYVDITTFNVDDEAVELNANKVYIDSSTNVLYRYNGEELSKACMWTDRGKVFTQSFSFSVYKTWHKENMIITATAKWVGTTAPTIRMRTMPNGGQLNLKYTMRYFIGAKNTYSTKEWRPYNPLIHQDKVLVDVAIPAGTTLMVDEFTNYYSSRTERGTYPQFHYRSGNGLNQGLTSWEEAAKLGYEYIIVIPKRTADDPITGEPGKWVIFHDDSNINSMYNENGTAVTGSSAIGNYTYEQLLQYDIATGLAFKGNKIPLLEDFFALCAKRGIHPCFSVHPNFTTEQWREVKALSDKWGVTKHLNLKAGYIIGDGCLLNTCYSVFGDNVESYYVDINRSGNGVSEVQNAISVFNIDTSKVRVGIEYFHAYATDANINAARDAGIPVGVVTDAPSADGSGGDSASEIQHWIDLGVSSFTDVINPSVGLNW